MSSATPQLELRSSIPGRSRWRVASIYRNPSAARRLRERLEADPRVDSALTNPRSASVLIRYDPATKLNPLTLLLGATGRVEETTGAAAEDATSTAEEDSAAAGPRGSLARLDDPLGELLDRVGVERAILRRATLAPVLAAAGAFLPNLSFAILTDSARNKGNAFLAGRGVSDVKTQLWGLGASVLVGFGIQLLLERHSKQRWLNLAAEIEARAKLTAFDHIQRLDMAYIDEQSTGGLLNIMVDDAAAIRRYYEEGYTDIVKKLTGAVLINGLLFWASPTLGIMANISLPLIVLASRYFGPRTAAAYGQASIAQAEFTRALNDDLSGIATIKSFTNEDLELERLGGLNDEIVDAKHSAFEARFRNSSTTQGLFYASWATTVTQAGYLLVQERIGTQTFSVVLFAVPQLIASMFGIDETTDSYRRARAGAERLVQVLDVDPGIVDGDTILTHSRTRKLQIEQARFGYDDTPILDGLDIEFSPGVTAIVGGSGSGKSTIVKLLLRFYDLDEGRILLDGHDIRELSLANLRGQFGYVAQDPYLFPGTIEDNIRYGCPSADSEAVREVAKAAEIADFIESLEHGYQTRVGERGARLSGGQRQRICIARALLKNPPILLFDEATAALDNKTERALQRSIRRMSKTRTVVVIAHRLASIRDADRIIVLEEGHVKESGTHDELLTQRGLYHALWRHQAGA